MSPEIENAYRLLDVTPEASDKEMRSAWRKLVRRYHPDLAKTDPEEASRRMAEINAAFDALAHHRSKEPEAEPKPQPRRAKPRAAKPAKPKARRTTENAQARTSARPKQDAPRKETAQSQTAPKKAAKWSSGEQNLVDAARAMFEGTRRKLNDAARRPVFSVCH